MRHWTREERNRQALIIQCWKPWKQSTGAKTSEGKNKSKMNAFKQGGKGRTLAEMKHILVRIKDQYNDILKNI